MFSRGIDDAEPHQSYQKFMQLDLTMTLGALAPPRPCDSQKGGMMRG